MAYGKFGAMGRVAKRLATLTLGLLSFAAIAAAQSEQPSWTGNIGFGSSPLMGPIDKRLDNGWHTQFGAGYRFTSHFSLGGEVMYNGFGVSKGVLNELAVPNGNAHLWAFTAEPRLSFAPFHRVNPYIVGGVGYYRRVVEFTQPSVAQVTVFDPFFGFFPAFIPADQVIGRVIRDGIGGNAGIGFSVPIGSTRAKFFTEARFHYADTGRIPTRMIPFTIGVRF